MKRMVIQKKSWLWGALLISILGAVIACKKRADEPLGAAGSIDTAGELVADPNAVGAAAVSCDIPVGGKVNNRCAELRDQPSIVEGPFLGGPTGTKADTQIDIPRASLDSFSIIPTGGHASPLFGALPFTQKLLLFEEFGTEKIVANATPVPFPVLVDSPNPETDTEHGSPMHKSAPDKVTIDALIGENGLNPAPTRLANTRAQNPWKTQICGYLNHPACARAPMPAEGRPPGEGWAHQRWDEFYPQRLTKTSQSGARENLGVRDPKQMHKYAVGEFGPGGLYHNTVGKPGFNGTTKGIKPQFHPNMPVQHFTKLWTFDGTFPMKLVMARYNEPILFRHYNLLPIDVSHNGGFGLHTISTHEHNGHNPSESDGFANAFFFPGQFYDYHWPMAVAGHDSVNKTATDKMMGTPCAAGETMRLSHGGAPTNFTCDVSADPLKKSGRINVRGDWHEIMSSHWFHDHMIDFTSKNVYKGNAASMNYYSSIDRGNESLNDGVNLRLPSGSALPWGNRDYDVNLSIGDKAWDQDGQLWFNPFDQDGFLGDNMVVNLTWKPTMDVRARRYRFRTLNAAVARYFKLAIVRKVAGTTGSLKGPAGSGESFEPVVFHLIANDGNLMTHSVALDGTLGTMKGTLPTQSIAERYDFIIDFAANGMVPGDQVFMINTLEHTSGKLPNREIPLASILDGSYAPTIVASNWTGGDPGVGKFLRFDIKPCVNAANAAIPCVDPSLNPAKYVEGNKNGAGGTALTMIPQPAISAAELASAKHHTFDFVRSGATEKTPWSVITDGVKAHGADMRRISNASNLADVDAAGLGKVQIWHISNTSGGWSHPVHVHFEEGRVLTRGGKAPPIWEKYARKDMYRVGPEADSTNEVTMAIRIREFAGSYMEHCHNTTHEDNSMLVRWDSEKPGQTMMMPTPSPTWYGVNFANSVAETTFRNGKASLMKTSFVSLGGVIAPGQVMAVQGVGSNCSFTATMRDDGNFVVARGGVGMFQSNTTTKAAGGRAKFLLNGSLAVLKADLTTVAWQSGARGGADKLVLDGDGRFSVKGKLGAVLWQGTAPVAGCKK